MSLQMIDTAVKEFAQAMRKKLYKKSEEKLGWKGETKGNLFYLLIQETDELIQAILDEDPEEIKAEAVDVANFALMIFDNAQDIALQEGRDVYSRRSS